MQDDKVKSAVAEAKRFLKAAEAWRKASEAHGYYYCPRESGALRRASMDLTRALADMRKPAS